MLETQTVSGDELPCRIKWGKLHSAGVSPGAAMVAMLSVGGYIPVGVRDRKEVARHIFWNYESFPPWGKIIHILDTDSFD